MKKSKFILTIIVITAFIFHSCKDEDTNPDPTNTNKTNTEKISGHQWQLTKATFNPPVVLKFGTFDTSFVNLFDIPLIEPCQKDNLFIFNIDSTITVDNGPLLCSGEPQSMKDGNWRFINNETQIEITNSEYFSLISADKVIIDKVVLTNTEMKGQTDYKYTDPGTQQEVTTKIDFTFTHK